MIWKPHDVPSVNLCLAVAAFAQVTVAQSSTPSHDVAPYEVVEQGEDYSVYRWVQALADDSGRVTVKTNQFHLLENCLNYFEDGRWKESEDLIESAPEGAIAKRGPNKAVFSGDLNSPAVFNVLLSDGQRLRGGVRAIQLTDVLSERSVTLASVKQSVPGELLPPNRIVYPDAFNGLKADVVLVWKHNFFSQDVVLREQPKLPEGMDPESTRLEIITELIEAPKPDVRTQTVPAGRLGNLEDDVVIHFGRMAFVMGGAYPLDGDFAWSVGGLDPSRDSQPVLKQWRTLPDGRTFLVESVGWTNALTHLKRLPSATEASVSPAAPRRLPTARVWPSPVTVSTNARPMQLAQLDYHPKGYVLDFVTIPDAGTPPVLSSATTYYIKTSYYSGSSVTFQPGCFIKFKNNAYLLLYGTVSFPTAGQTMPVFTSRNDNNFGEVIQGVSGEADSNGDPTLHQAAKAIWIYYVTFPTTIQDVRIRWAQTGVRYDSNPGVCPTHTLRDSRFQYCSTGISLNFSCSSTTVLNLVNVKKCAVSTPVTGSGYFAGSITEDCDVVSIARINDPAQDTATGDPNKNSQSECSFVVVDANKIVAAFFDTHLSVYGLGEVNFPGVESPRSTGWAVSVNGGATFTDNGAIPPTIPTDPTQGDAGDPVMVRDASNGTIYLLVNPSRESATWKSFRLWKSTDAGQSFVPINSNIFTNSGMLQGDKPALAINNFTGLSNSGYLYAAGTMGSTVTVGTSTDGGLAWNDITSFGSNPGRGAEIAIRPDGTVYLFWVNDSAPIGLWYSWRRVGDGAWHVPVQIAAHSDSLNIYATGSQGSGNPKRSNSALPGDWFSNNAMPKAAVNPVNGRIYLVYADLPSAASPTPTDRGDIFINEGVAQSDGSLGWTGARRLNNDGTATDQWNPSIAINPAGTQLFVGYYSRQGDPVNNGLIKAYGAKMNLANGFATATYDVFPISSTAFPPMFPGPPSSTPPANWWMYDHVWIQGGVCLDSNAVWSPCPGFETSFATYINFMGDDYTWASADGAYFYFAWCDRSDPYVTSQGTRPDPNIRFGKVRQ